MVKFLQNLNKKKCSFVNNFVWKKYGLYYTIPVHYRYGINMPKIKIASKSRGGYYEKVVNDYIYLYSSGFQKDCYGRLKTIPMIKKHKRALWVDKNDKYLDYDLVDMVRISYKDNGILSFVATYNFSKTRFWLFNFSPNKYYKALLKTTVKRENLFSTFDRCLDQRNEKLYGVLKVTKKDNLFFETNNIFLIKYVWDSWSFIFITSNGYCFFRKGALWITLGVFDGLHYILKGPGKNGIKWSLRLSYLLGLYYTQVFFKNLKKKENYIRFFLYNVLSRWCLVCLKRTLKKQRLEFRPSNRFLWRYVQCFMYRFYVVQSRFFNYYKNLYISQKKRSKNFLAYFFYSKRFNYLNKFEGSLFKDRRKLRVWTYYSKKDKLRLFKTIIYLLQFNNIKQSSKSLGLRKLSRYFIKKSSLLYASLKQISIKHYIFNPFFLGGYFMNCFVYKSSVDSFGLNYYENKRYLYYYEEKHLFPKINYDKFQTTFGNLMKQDKILSIISYKSFFPDTVPILERFNRIAIDKKYVYYDALENFFILLGQMYKKLGYLNFIKYDIDNVKQVIRNFKTFNPKIKISNILSLLNKKNKGKKKEYFNDKINTLFNSNLMKLMHKKNILKKKSYTPFSFLYKKRLNDSKVEKRSIDLYLKLKKRKKLISNYLYEYCAWQNLKISENSDKLLTLVEESLSKKIKKPFLRWYRKATLLSQIPSVVTWNDIRTVSPKRNKSLRIKKFLKLDKLRLKYLGKRYHRKAINKRTIKSKNKLTRERFPISKFIWYFWNVVSRRQPKKFSWKKKKLEWKRLKRLRLLRKKKKIWGKKKIFKIKTKKGFKIWLKKRLRKKAREEKKALKAAKDNAKKEVIEEVKKEAIEEVKKEVIEEAKKESKDEVKEDSKKDSKKEAKKKFKKKVKKKSQRLGISNYEMEARARHELEHKKLPKEVIRKCILAGYDPILTKYFGRPIKLTEKSKFIEMVNKANKADALLMERKMEKRKKQLEKNKQSLEGKSKELKLNYLKEKMQKFNLTWKQIKQIKRSKINIKNDLEFQKEETPYWIIKNNFNVAKKALLKLKQNNNAFLSQKIDDNKYLQSEKENNVYNLKIRKKKKFKS